MIDRKKDQIIVTFETIDDIEEHYTKKTAMTRLAISALKTARVEDIAEVLDLTLKIELHPKQIGALAKITSS